MIISITTYPTNHIDALREFYQKNHEKKEVKTSTYYILYKILDNMYDKTITMLKKFTKDVSDIEEQLFSSPELEKTSLSELMIKKRNIIALKHMFIPHQDILYELQRTLPK